jgi:hypothetical protein
MAHTFPSDAESYHLPRELREQREDRQPHDVLAERESIERLVKLEPAGRA